MKEITYTYEAMVVMDSMPDKMERRIKEKLSLYAENPNALSNNVTALQGDDNKRNGFLRLKVGNWRIIFTETGEVISVKDVGLRDKIYRKYR